MSAALLTLVAFLCAAYAVGEESCNIRRDVECGRTLSSIFRATPLITDQVLTNNCSDITENWQCLEDYLEECNDEGYEIFTDYFSSPKQLFQELCTPNSPLRIAYRQHVTCLRRGNFRSIVSELDRCFENLDESTIEEFRVSERKAQMEGKMTAILCAVYEPIKNCLKEMTARYCGNIAGNLVEVLIQSATLMPREKYC